VQSALMSIASVVLSAGESWAAGQLIEAPTKAGSAPVTPYEPSTLVLALIGIGTIAIFLLATGRPRRTDVAAPTGRLIGPSARRPGVPRTEQQRSRGAA
jgi:hypothetical protein